MKDREKNRERVPGKSLLIEFFLTKSKIKSTRFFVYYLEKIRNSEKKHPLVKQPSASILALEQTSVPNYLGIYVNPEVMEAFGETERSLMS